MTKTPLVLAIVALGSLACATADAKKIASPMQVTAKSPYTVELVSDSGERLDTYQHRGRFYVNGQQGERYSIRVNNPTDRRVEAVISVDGLDVIDGESADFRSKRGYVVPPRGNLVIDGFRVSTQAVAAFRFSSVSASYAGRKGKARNVGVVGVALFAERAQPQMVLPVQPTVRPFPHTHGRNHDHRPAPPRDDFRGEGKSASADSGSADRPSESATRAPRVGSLSGGAPSRPSPGIRPDFEPKKERSGLATEFGERRNSAATFTRFVRANETHPTSFAELRYNNSRGLEALGIRLRFDQAVSQEELATRESANAFPGTHFSQPPR